MCLLLPPSRSSALRSRKSRKCARPAMRTTRCVPPLWGRSTPKGRRQRGAKPAQLHPGRTNRHPNQGGGELSSCQGESRKLGRKIACWRKDAPGSVRGCSFARAEHESSPWQHPSDRRAPSGAPVRRTPNLFSSSRPRKPAFFRVSLASGMVGAAGAYRRVPAQAWLGFAAALVRASSGAWR